MQTEPETLPRPASIAELPELALEEGTPLLIRDAACLLMRRIRAGSVDADGFAQNVTLALTAMGVTVPPMFQAVIGNALRSSFDAA